MTENAVTPPPFMKKEVLYFPVKLYGFYVVFSANSEYICFRVIQAYFVDKITKYVLNIKE